MLSNLLSLDRSSREPLARQVFLQIRQLIEDGLLNSGVLLPTSRRLAQELRVGRNTVVAAYEQLVLEGYIEADGRRGTRVSLASRGFAEQKAQEARGSSHANLPRLSKTARALSRINRVSLIAHVSFQTGLPEVRHFPHDLWGRLLRRAARKLHARPTLGSYDYYCGLPRLKEAILGHVSRTRGVVGHPDRVIALSSAQAALDLVSRLLLDPGDEAVIEEPGYAGILAALKAVGANIRPFMVEDGSGGEARYSTIDPDWQPRLLYVTPSHQFPSGRRMSLEQRLDLLDYAGARDAFILEDDYDSEFQFRGEPISCLQGLDRQDQVIYMGTFSKSLMPALRVAYLILPSRLATVANRMLRNVGSVPSLVVQLALADFIQEGHFRAHLRDMNRHYAERHDVMIQALDAYCNAFLTVFPGTGGIQLPAYFSAHALSQGWSDVALVEHINGLGLEASCLSLHYWSGSVVPRQGLFLGYAASSPEEIKTGIARLGDILARYRP